MWDVVSDDGEELKICNVGLAIDNKVRDRWFGWEDITTLRAS